MNDNIVLSDKVKYHNGGVRCDMFSGPCACGAWHKPEHWPQEIIDEHK